MYESGYKAHVSLETMILNHFKTNHMYLYLYCLYPVNTGGIMFQRFGSYIGLKHKIFEGCLIVRKDDAQGLILNYYFYVV